jgi:protein TonB
VLLGFNHDDTASNSAQKAVSLAPPPWVAPKLPDLPPENLVDYDGPKPEIEAPARRVPVLDPVILNPREGMETTPPIFVPDNRADMLGPITNIPPGDYLRKGGDGKGRTPVLDMRFLDHTPGVRHRVAPVYPHSLKNAGVEGAVTVVFVVDEKGYVSDVRVLDASHREFEEPTLRAVGKWRFEPGRKNGAPVRFRMQVPIVFSLNDSE